MTDPTTAADGLWERLAQDIHAHGYSVRDALAAWRPAIEAEAAAPYREALKRLVNAVPGTAVNLASSEPFDLGRAVIEARALLAAEVASSDAGVRREVGE